MTPEDKAALIAEFALRLFMEQEGVSVETVLDQAAALVNGAIRRAAEPDLADFDGE